MRRLALVVALAGCSSSKGPAPADRAPADRAPARDAAEDLAVTGLSPTTGDELGGTLVRITGRRYLADGVRTVKVYFGSVQAQVLRFESDGVLLVQAPGGKLGTVDVKLYFEPGGVLTLPAAFTFAPGP